MSDWRDRVRPQGNCPICGGKLHVIAIDIEQGPDLRNGVHTKARFCCEGRMGTVDADSPTRNSAFILSMEQAAFPIADPGPSRYDREVETETE